MPLYNPIKAMFVFLTVSETQCIIYRPDLRNSQASRKKLKKQLMVEFNFLSMSKPKILQIWLALKVPDIPEISLTYRIFKKQENG